MGGRGVGGREKRRGSERLVHADDQEEESDAV